MLYVAELQSGPHLQYHPDEWAGIAASSGGDDAGQSAPSLRLRATEVVVRAVWQRGGRGCTDPAAEGPAPCLAWTPPGAGSLPMLALLTTHRLLVLDAGLNVITTVPSASLRERGEALPSSAARPRPQPHTQRVTSCMWVGPTLLFSCNSGLVGAVTAGGTVMRLCSLDAAIEDPVLVRVCAVAVPRHRAVCACVSWVAVAGSPALCCGSRFTSHKPPVARCPLTFVWRCPHPQASVSPDTLTLLHTNWRSGRVQVRTRLFPTADALLLGYLDRRRLHDATPHRAHAVEGGTAAAAAAPSPFDAPPAGGSKPAERGTPHARDVAWFGMLAKLVRAQCLSPDTVVMLVSAGLLRSAALLLTGQREKASAGRLKR